MQDFSFKKLTTLGATTLAAALLVSSVASADTFRLKIGSGQPMKPLEPIFTANGYFAPEVEKRVAARTKHKVKFTKLWNTVSGPFDVLESVEKGVFDIGLWCACFEPTKAEHMAFHYYVPFVTDDPKIQLKITQQAYKEFPAWTAALGKYKQRWLGSSAFSTYGLGTSFAWDKMSDLKGHKIGGAGLNLPWLKLSGATVVQTSLNEAYNSIRSGVYEGMVIFPPAWLGFKLNEPAKHYKVVGWGSTMLYQMTMNQNSYDKLPAEVRKIIDEVRVEWMAKGTEEASNRFVASIKKLTSTGSTVTFLPQKERAVMAKVLDSWSNEKAKKFDSQGLPGSKLFKRYMDIAEANGIKLPHRYNIK